MSPLPNKSIYMYMSILTCCILDSCTVGPGLIGLILRLFTDILTYWHTDIFQCLVCNTVSSSMCLQLNHKFSGLRWWNCRPLPFIKWEKFISSLSVLAGKPIHELWAYQCMWIDPWQKLCPSAWLSVQFNCLNLYLYLYHCTERLGHLKQLTVFLMARTRSHQTWTKCGIVVAALRKGENPNIINHK